MSQTQGGKEVRKTTVENQITMNLAKDLSREEAFIVALESMAEEQHGRMKEKGFYGVAFGIGNIVRSYASEEYCMTFDIQHDLGCIAKFTEEIGELVSAVRKPGPSEHIPDFTNEEEEWSDLLLRMLDYAGRKKLRVGRATIAKMEFNTGCPQLHGKLS